MSDRNALLQVKRRASSALLTLAGVSGVGIADDRVRIYLETESDAARQHINDWFAQHAAGVAYEVVVGGRFTTR